MSKKCEYCGATLPDGVYRCNHCGAFQPAQNERENDKPTQIIINNYNAVPNNYPQTEYKSAERAENAESEVKKESSVWGRLSVFFGLFALFPLGIAFGIAGLCKYEKRKNRKRCITGIVLSCIWILIALISIITRK